MGLKVWMLQFGTFNLALLVWQFLFDSLSLAFKFLSKKNVTCFTQAVVVWQVHFVSLTLPNYFDFKKKSQINVISILSYLKVH